MLYPRPAPSVYSAMVTSADRARNVARFSAPVFTCGLTTLLIEGPRAGLPLGRP